MSVDIRKETDRKETTRFFPVAIFIHLLLAGIVILFLGLCYSYLFNNNKQAWQEFKLPKIFWASTFCILSVSFFLKQCLKFYEADKPRQLKSSLLLSFLFAVAFIICQMVGWKQLQSRGITLQGTPSASYLYLITGLHAVHVLAGIIFLSVALVRIFIYTKDEVSSLVYFSDPLKKIRLRLLTHYWHTIDFLWLFLFCVLLYQHA